MLIADVAVGLELSSICCATFSSLAISSMSSEPGGPVGAVYKTGITTRDLVVYHRFRNSLIRATWAMVDSSVVGMRLLHCDRVELGSILPLWELLHVYSHHT